MPPSNAKARLIETMRALLRRKGYHGTGLKQVLQESGSPRGSLYFHFPGGKEELAAEAIHSGCSAIAARFAGLDLQRGPGEVLEQVAAIMAAELEGSGYEHGCPAATVALEEAPFSDRLQEACLTNYQTYIDLLCRLFEPHVDDAEAAREWAFLVLATLEGAQLLAKTWRSPEPLQIAGRRLRTMFEARQGGDRVSKGDS